MPKFTDAETRVLRALVATAPRSHPTVAMLLGSIEAKLPAPDWCVHCDAEPRRYSDGLCLRCGNYQRSMGHLPNEAVLRRRQERADERRMARGA